MLDAIISGLSVLSSVSEILSSMERRDSTREMMRDVRKVEQMIEELRREVSFLNGSRPVPSRVMASYNKIIEKVRLSPGYDSLLWLSHTPDGFWVVKRRRRGTILRDPCGEYAVAHGAAEVGVSYGAVRAIHWRPPPCDGQGGRP